MMCDNLDIELTSCTAFSLTVIFDTRDEVIKAYNILKEDSIIIDPLHSTTYSSCEVVLIDKFGFRWGLMAVHAKQ